MEKGRTVTSLAGRRRVASPADGGADAQAGEGGVEPVVKSAERSVRLLEVLAASERRLSLAALQAATGIPKSSLHVLLRTLTRAGWLEQGGSNDGFGIGPRALICGTAYLDRDPALPLGIEAIEALRAEVGYTTNYGRLDGSNVLYLATRDSTERARLVWRVGRCLPAHLTALGLVLLADRTEDEIEAVLPRELPALTEHSMTERAQVHEAIGHARAAGVAVEREQNTGGICCVARAVSYRIPATDSISCALPSSLATDDEIARVADAVTRHADRLAVALRRAGIR